VEDITTWAIAAIDIIGVVSYYHCEYRFRFLTRLVKYQSLQWPSVKQTATVTNYGEFFPNQL